ncbi:MAG: hypothetical protein NUW37_08855 [Planctomycetes bacterium]|nr:hypothetical protein [Planctomycetota bacterium]
MKKKSNKVAKKKSSRKMPVVRAEFTHETIAEPYEQGAYSAAAQKSLDTATKFLDAHQERVRDFERLFDGEEELSDADLKKFIAMSRELYLEQTKRVSLQQDLRAQIRLVETLQQSAIDKGALDAAKAEIEELKAQNQALQRSIDGLKEQTKLDARQGRSELDKARKEATSAQIELETVQRELASAQKQIEKEQERAGKSSEKLKDELDTLKKEFAASKKSNQQEVSQKDEEIENLRKEMAAARKEAAESGARKKDYDSLKRKAELAQAEIQDMRRILDSQLKEKARLEERIVYFGNQFKKMQD